MAAKKHKERKEPFPTGWNPLQNMRTDTNRLVIRGWGAVSLLSFSLRDWIGRWDMLDGGAHGVTRPTFVATGIEMEEFPLRPLCLFAANTK